MQEIIQKKSTRRKEFVLKNGKEYTSFSEKKINLGEMKLCFMNSFKLISRSSDLVYVEGFTIPSSVRFPVLHAWCVTREGEIIDPTWKVPGIEYFGVAFKPEFVWKTACEREMYGVIDNMEQGFPLLRGIPETEWKF